MEILENAPDELTDEQVKILLHEADNLSDEEMKFWLERELKEIEIRAGEKAAATELPACPVQPGPEPGLVPH